MITSNQPNPEPLTSMQVEFIARVKGEDIDLGAITVNEGNWMTSVPGALRKIADVMDSVVDEIITEQVSDGD